MFQANAAKNAKLNKQQSFDWLTITYDLTSSCLTFNVYDNIKSQTEKNRQPTQFGLVWAALAVEWCE